MTAIASQRASEAPSLPSGRERRARDLELVDGLAWRVLERRGRR